MIRVDIYKHPLYKQMVRSKFTNSITALWELLTALKTLITWYVCVVQS